MKYALLAFLLTGCGEVLANERIGINGATAILKAECPPGTSTVTSPKCEEMRLALNAAIASYNAGLLADAVNVNHGDLDQQTMSDLGAVYDAIKELWHLQ